MQKNNDVSGILIKNSYWQFIAVLRIWVKESANYYICNES